MQHDELLKFRKEWLDDKPYIIAHTSGSTGTPKEIRLPKGDMEVSARATCRRFGIGPGTLLYLPLSVDYIAGKMMAVRAWVSGAELVAATPSSDPLKEWDGREITLLAIVPAQIDALLKTPGIDKIKYVIVGGAPMTAAQEEALRQAPFRSFATYGMTETCSHVALRDISSGQSCYEAMPGVTFDVDDRGCLIINAPEYSFKQLVTNDIVELLDNRRFVWKGRYDNVIITGGLKVMPEEVESRLASLMGNIPFMITSRPSERWGSEVIMLVEGDVDAAALMARSRERLPRHAAPKEIIRVEALPRASNGKLRRK